MNKKLKTEDRLLSYQFFENYLLIENSKNDVEFVSHYSKVGQG